MWCVSLTDKGGWNSSHYFSSELETVDKDWMKTLIHTEKL